MNAVKNPDYLRGVSSAVCQFQDAFEAFMGLHTFNEHLARGLAPAVFPRERVETSEIAEAATLVDKAAGRASSAPALTHAKIKVQGVGTVDPIAAWRTISQPKPLLEPDDIRSACDQMVGRLDDLIQRAEADDPPPIGPEAMHPLVWGAARRLWRDAHFGQAIASSAEALIAHVKIITGRKDLPATSLWQETFSVKPPQPGKPRLRWPGDPADQEVKSMTDGLRQFAPGVQMTIRNHAAHRTTEMSEQVALERLATLSLLARMVDECDLVSVEE